MNSVEGQQEKEQNKVNYLKQRVYEIESYHKDILEQKNTQLQHMEQLFENMKKQIEEYIEKEYQIYEQTLKDYVKYQRFQEVTQSQLLEFLDSYQEKFNLSSQVEKLLSMNIDTLNFFNRKVCESQQQSQKRYKHSLRQLHSSIQDGIESTIASQIKQNAFLDGYQLSINKILEEIKSFNLKINPLDEIDQQQHMIMLTNQMLQKYIESNQIAEQGERSPGIQTEQSIDGNSDKLQEEKETQQDIDVVKDEEIQKPHEVADVCVPGVPQQQDNISQEILIQTSHTLKEYPKRFNPQTISIPKLQSSQYPNVVVGGWDGTLELINIQTQQRVNVHTELFQGPIHCIKQLNSSNQIAVCATENTSRVILFDKKIQSESSQKDKISSQNIVDLQEMSINNNILSSSLIVVKDKEVLFYELIGYSLISSFTIQQDYSVLQARVLDNKNILFTTQQGDILHYSLQDFQLLKIIKANQDWVHLVNVQRQQAQQFVFILTASYENKVQLRSYNIETLEDEVIYELACQLPKNITLVDQNRILVASQNILSFYEQGQLIKEIPIEQLDEIEDICLLQQQIVISGKSEKSQIVVI